MWKGGKSAPEKFTEIFTAYFWWGNVLLCVNRKPAAIPFSTKHRFVGLKAYIFQNCVDNPIHSINRFTPTNTSRLLWLFIMCWWITNKQTNRGALSHLSYFSYLNGTSFMRGQEQFRYLSGMWKLAPYRQHVCFVVEEILAPEQHTLQRVEI